MSSFICYKLRGRMILTLGAKKSLCDTVLFTMPMYHVYKIDFDTSNFLVQSSWSWVVDKCIMHVMCSTLPVCKYMNNVCLVLTHR